VVEVVVEVVVDEYDDVRTLDGAKVPAYTLYTQLQSHRVLDATLFALQVEYSIHSSFWWKRNVFFLFQGHLMISVPVNACDVVQNVPANGTIWIALIKRQICTFARKVGGRSGGGGVGYTSVLSLQ